MTALGKRRIHWTEYVVLLVCILGIPYTESYGQGKSFPEREIKIVCGAAGSPADLWIRSWSDDFAKILKVPVIVVNKGGDLSAPMEVKKAKPDGYTVGYVSQSQLVILATNRKPPFDPLKDFVPVGAFGSFPTVVAVEKSAPFMTFEELVEYAKKNPKKLKCGTAGLSTSYFNFELLKQQTKMDIEMVQFKGSPPAVTALLGKHIDLLSLNPSALVGLLKAGRVRILLTTDKLKDLPDVPLFSSKGVAEGSITAWSGLWVESGVPKDAQSKLADAFGRVAKDPESKKRIESLGYIPDYYSAGELAIRVKKDYEKIAALAQGLGLIE